MDIAQAVVGYKYPILGLILTIGVILYLWGNKMRNSISDDVSGASYKFTNDYPDEQEVIENSMNADIADIAMTRRGQLHSSFRARDWMVSELQPRKSQRW